MRQVTGMHLNVAVQGNVPNLSITKLDGDVSNTPQPAPNGTATLTMSVQWARSPTGSGTPNGTTLSFARQPTPESAAFPR